MAFKITDKCHGCDDCAQLCPVGAVSGDMKEQHSIDPERCIECSACLHICEYESILDADGKAGKYIPREQWKKPVIDTKLCNGCGICVEDCPAFCLELVPGEDGVRHVSSLALPDDCHSCGVCVRHCPVSAVKI